MFFELGPNNDQTTLFSTAAEESPAFPIDPITFISVAPMHWISTGEADGFVRSLSYTFVANSMWDPLTPQLRSHLRLSSWIFRCSFSIEAARIFQEDSSGANELERTQPSKMGQSEF